MNKRIEIIQGDVSLIYKFQRKNSNGEVIPSLPQKMWITFKESNNSNGFLFQKTLENGITYSNDDNYYRFQIESNDTCNLDYGCYGFDISILNENGDKKTLLNDGELMVLKHFTRKNNEV